MKTKATYIIVLAALLSSCNDEFLDCAPLDQITSENFWQSEDHLKAAANVFSDSFMGKDWLNRTEIMADSAPWSATTAWRTIGGGYYTSDISQINSVWVGAYSNIGRVNYFLANYQRATSVKEAIRERYAAEAYFYRAYNYWLLTSYFGDVPYITDELDVNSPDVYRGRDARAEVVANVTKDLEEHYKALPEYIEAASNEFGRITQMAALVLLQRLYLYNGMPDKALDAADRAMALPYYELYSTGKPKEDYLNLFNFTGRASRNANNHETILAQVFNDKLGESARYAHNLSRELTEPTDYVRWVPTESMVECYLTSDGKIWDPSTAATYADVFKNRDPRMAQSIYAPGTPWKGGRAELNDANGYAIFNLPKFVSDKNGAMSASGYYMRKYAEMDILWFVGHDDNDIVMMRYAEVLLNYIEAKELVGGVTQNDIDKTINLIRDRVGMKRLTLTNIPAGSDLRTEIRRERRVELFFEGLRYFDIIRWQQGELLGNDLLGVNRRWVEGVGLNIDGLKWKKVGSEEYLVFESGRTFDPGKHYLLSLPFAQMQLNPNLKPNNPGWN
ncbi:MAG: RagB/SusD family nutrient uptake outer membrane protein [Tidjanibacter sp.]|nr:RagB/SusD family nutrient uptake outer membrane protein [Tidjanibacter sp.]